ncbi:hypothetical protein SARC_12690 [Sphaeroforma arctica JP610]|uniref:Uncharacterized protein n=1 Tax=Sphaeroforma arctica JP610 TaxID=667725 RepID=A0A0L0FDC4_9EUKA|nr:hypothetical protein SARC_12690 [Sphaeroforma arctica JP610]KNC74769.1 hypothetical protein SARC_12690 [Sphaeroforma arctica JP610]|eukprot:XP_014148671.1 hypothetical protein SARC_12690 [Sphaeroforma arctica JP610]
MSSTGDDAAVTPADIAQRLYERMPNLITNSDMDAEMFMELMSLKKDQYIHDTQAYRSRDWEGPHQDEVWVDWVAKAMKAFSAKLTAKENQPLCDKEIEPVIEEICSIYDGVRNLVISDNILQRVQDAGQKDKISPEEAGSSYQSGGEGVW